MSINYDLKCSKWWGVRDVEPKWSKYFDEHNQEDNVADLPRIHGAEWLLYNVGYATKKPKHANTLSKSNIE
jgi:hypothetical protein